MAHWKEISANDKHVTVELPNPNMSKTVDVSSVSGELSALLDSVLAALKNPGLTKNVKTLLISERANYRILYMDQEGHGAQTVTKDLNASKIDALIAAVEAATAIEED